MLTSMDKTIEDVCEELRRRRGTWRQICADTGLDYSWLQKLAQGRIRSPGYIKIQILQRHLFGDGANAA